MWDYFKGVRDSNSTTGPIKGTFKDYSKFFELETNIFHRATSRAVLMRVYLSITEAHAESSGLFWSCPFYILGAHVAFLPPTPNSTHLNSHRDSFPLIHYSTVSHCAEKGSFSESGAEERHDPPEECSVLGLVRYQSSVQLCPERTFPYSSSREFRLFTTTNCQHHSHHISQQQSATSLDQSNYPTRRPIVTANPWSVRARIL